MKFEETNTIKIDKIQDIFIYFLINKNEVVYVGQTKNGLIRPYQHKYNKDFDSIQILFCNENELDKLEDFYIKKYKPKYNKMLNTSTNYSLNNVKNQIKRVYPKFNQIQLNKIINILNIKVYQFKNTLWVSSNDFVQIFNYYDTEVHYGRIK